MKLFLPFFHPFLSRRFSFMDSHYLYAPFVYNFATLISVTFLNPMLHYSVVRYFFELWNGLNPLKTLSFFGKYVYNFATSTKCHFFINKNGLKTGSQEPGVWEGFQRMGSRRYRFRRLKPPL